MLICNTPAVTLLPPSLAVIDGTLSELTRNGARTRCIAPLATAVVEFRQGPLCVYVREHPYGLLPGISNLYCLDADLKLQWLAEWPDADDPCVQIMDVSGDTLIAEAASGALVHLDRHTGRLQRVTHRMAVAS